MTLQDLKDWIDSLPKEFMEYFIVHAEILKLETGDSEDDYTVRMDKPITALTVDEENKEILIMNDASDEETDLDLSTEE